MCGRPFGVQELHKIQDGIVFPDLGASTSHTVDRFTFTAVREWREKKRNHL